MLIYHWRFCRVNYVITETWKNITHSHQIDSSEDVSSVQSSIKMLHPQNSISIRARWTRLPSCYQATSELYCSIPNSLRVCQLYIIIRDLLHVELASGFVTGSLFAPASFILLSMIATHLLNTSSGCLDPKHSTQHVLMLYENKRQKAVACFQKSNLSEKPRVLMLREGERKR